MRPVPRLSLRSNRWAEISERLRRTFNLNQYPQNQAHDSLRIQAKFCMY